MNFMNIGSMEVMVIVAIAILVVGPKRLVQIARTIGRLTAKMRSISGEFTSIMRTELSELEDVKREVTQAIGEVTGSVSQSGDTADVTGAVKAAKQEADRSLRSIIDEGLGLSELAAELKATVTDARQLVQKAEQDETQKAEVVEEAQPQPAAQEQGAETRETEAKPVVEGEQQVDEGTRDLGAAEQEAPEKPSPEPDQPVEPEGADSGPPSGVEAPTEAFALEGEASTEEPADGAAADNGAVEAPDAVDTQGDADDSPGPASEGEAASERAATAQREQAAVDQDAMVGGDDVRGE